ncbi:uncharacterized protein LOC133203021 [Saccostrea echinata]|uniref:uncharacterized protein LOC133203021 n=1 Tax=Saccostrea echinata TaxID=191078 RepID=UPI002A8199DE|nr:uncharacterized protein LOC133203021 [Saccostrea echinata]
MRKSAHSFSFICRSLKLLLLILLLCLVNASQVVSGFKFNLHKLPKTLNGSQTSLVRKGYLWNVCSTRFLRIKKPGSKGVDASGEKGKDFTLLKITSIDGGFVRIQGMDNNLFLCFNKKGKLRTRNRPPKSLPHSCDFSQNLTRDGFDTFKLRDRPDWSVGFKRNGRKLPGFLRPGKNHETCHHFSLEIIDGTVLTQPYDFDKLPKDYVFPKKRKNQNRQKRRRKIRHKRRKNLRRGRLRGRHLLEKPNGIDR